MNLTYFLFDVLFMIIIVMVEAARSRPKIPTDCAVKLEMRITFNKTKLWQQRLNSANQEIISYVHKFRLKLLQEEADDITRRINTTTNSQHTRAEFAYPRSPDENTGFNGAEESSPDARNVEISTVKFSTKRMLSLMSSSTPKQRKDQNSFGKKVVLSGSKLSDNRRRSTSKSPTPSSVSPVPNMHYKIGGGNAPISTTSNGGYVSKVITPSRQSVHDSSSKTPNLGIFRKSAYGSQEKRRNTVRVTPTVTPASRVTELETF